MISPALRCRSLLFYWVLTRRWGDPFKYFHISPEIIHLAVMVYVRFPLLPAERRGPAA